jgi:hypothetical protein
MKVERIRSDGRGGLAAGAAKIRRPSGGNAVTFAAFERDLRQGCRNGSLVVLDRDPEGELESHL